MTETELRKLAKELRGELNTKKELLDQQRKTVEKELAGTRSRLDEVLYALGEIEKNRREAYVRVVPEDMRRKEAKEGALARWLVQDLAAVSHDAERIRAVVEELKRRRADAADVEVEEKRATQYEGRCAEIREEQQKAQKAHEQTLEQIRMLLDLAAAESH